MLYLYNFKWYTYSGVMKEKGVKESDRCVMCSTRSNLHGEAGEEHEERQDEGSQHSKPGHSEKVDKYTSEILRYLLCLCYKLEIRGSTFLRNFGTHLPQYLTLHSGRQ